MSVYPKDLGQFVQTQFGADLDQEQVSDLSKGVAGVVQQEAASMGVAADGPALSDIMVSLSSCVSGEGLLDYAQHKAVYKAVETFVQNHVPNSHDHDTYYGAIKGRVHTAAQDKGIDLSPSPVQASELDPSLERERMHEQALEVQLVFNDQVAARECVLMHYEELNGNINHIEDLDAQHEAVAVLKDSYRKLSKEDYEYTQADMDALVGGIRTYDKDGEALNRLAEVTAERDLSVQEIRVEREVALEQGIDDLYPELAPVQ